LLLHIGIDDTDSPEGGCTTYIAALLIDQLETLGCQFVDYPNLLRLNPNAPWKTRGNGAICLRVNAPDAAEAEIKQIVLCAIESQAEFDCDNTNPGVVFHVGEINRELKEFHDRVVQRIVSLEEAERLISECCASAIGWKNRRGLIGALAAIGGTLEGDHTYELLTYRVKQNRGKPRIINEASVRRMEKVSSETFNSVDPETGQILLAPRGPDPVLYGVRGNAPEAVLAAHKLIEVREEIERWVIFRTNQGTDAHLVQNYVISELKSRYPVIVTGLVQGKTRIIEGGHVIFKICDMSGNVDCAAYEPSGKFRQVVLRLQDGDEIRAAGGVRETDMGLTINLERLEILSLAPLVRLTNPKCPRCGGGTESMGRGQGLRCKKCGYRGPEVTKIINEIQRDLSPALYLPPPRAERHLTKPFERYGKEKKYSPTLLYMPWHS